MVLPFTQGRRALIAGGQGARAAHRKAIQEILQFEEVEWAYGERGQTSRFSALAKSIRPGKYDIVFFLAAYSGHSSDSFVKACRTAEIKFVYLTRGYSVNQIIEAIKHQVIPRIHAEV